MLIGDAEEFSSPPLCLHRCYTFLILQSSYFMPRVSSIQTMESEWKVISTCVLRLRFFLCLPWLRPASNLLQSRFGSHVLPLILCCFCLFTPKRRKGSAALFKVTYTLFCALYCGFLTDRSMDTGLALLNSSSINMGQNKNMIPLDTAMFSRRHENKKFLCESACADCCANTSRSRLTLWVECEWMCRKPA